MPTAAAVQPPVLLLVNLGTPEAPTPPAVRGYLAQFLSDRRVVGLPRWLWWPLLYLLILPLRGARVAHKYAAIWLDRGSPLAVHTRDLAAALQSRLPELQVEWAMRYGQPALDAALARLHGRRVLVLPLYPQYSTSTTASVSDLVEAAPGVTARVLHDYHDAPEWIAAVVAGIRAHRDAHGRGQHLLLSFHGLPQRLVDGGDPYARQCVIGASLIAAELGLPEDAWSLAYQSRFGRERWLQPATADTLDALAARGMRTVDVACPGFAVDCLETLEEVAMLLAERFAQRGGTLRYIPSLNATPAHAEALAAIARRELDAWQ